MAHGPISRERGKCTRREMIVHHLRTRISATTYCQPVSRSRLSGMSTKFATASVHVGTRVYVCRVLRRMGCTATTDNEARDLIGEVPSICIPPQAPGGFEPFAWRSVAALMKQSSLLPRWGSRCAGPYTSASQRVRHPMTNWNAQQVPPSRLWREWALGEQSAPGGWASIKQSSLLPRRALHTSTTEATQLCQHVEVDQRGNFHARFVRMTSVSDAVVLRQHTATVSWSLDDERCGWGNGNMVQNYAMRDAQRVQPIRNNICTVSFCIARREGATKSTR